MLAPARTVQLAQARGSGSEASEIAAAAMLAQARTVPLTQGLR
jgi:hypothetical protein